MSRRASHMMRREGVYWLRIRTPAHLRLRLGRGELRRSLGTTRPDLASLRASIALAWVRELCFHIPTMPTLTPDNINALIVQFFRQLVDEVGIPTVPPGEEIDLWADEQKVQLEELGDQMETQLKQGTVPGLVRGHLVSFLSKQGMLLKELPSQQRADLEQGATRAALEQTKYIRFRLDKPVGAYVPEDQLFKGAFEAKYASGSASGMTGPTVSSAIKEYLAQHKSQWKAGTYRDNEKVLAWAETFFGTTTPLGVVKKADVAGLRQKFLQLAKHAKGDTLEQRLTDDPDKRILPRTASKYFDFVTAFFAWTVNEQGYLEHNPASGLVVKFKKSKSAAAMSATPEAVKLFFESPLFQGRLYNKAHKPGPLVIREGEYWLCIIQLLTGMRVGEIAQLHCTDVVLDGAPIPYMHVRTTDELGNVDAAKTAKTTSSIRKVPVPDLLIALGFSEFVEARRKAGKRLFVEFPGSTDGSTSDAATKFASRYLERIGQKGPGKATHWLRHAWTDAMRAGGAPQHIISKIDGHALGGMADVYGAGENLAACKEWIDKADFQFDLNATLFASTEKWQ